MNAASRLTRPVKLAAGLLLAALLYWWAVTPGQRQALPRAEAPEISLPDVNGRMATLSSFRGKVVLLDFWATWCEPCLEELPDLIRLHEARKNEGFTMVGVAMDADGAAVVGSFVRQNKIPYPILLSNGEPPAGYPIPGFPTAFLIDRDGRILRRYLGPKGYEEIERDLAEALGR